MIPLRTGQTTHFSDQGTEFSVSPVESNSPTITETRYTPDFGKWNGYYTQIPELRTVINKFASWTFGRGIKADEKNQAKLDKIKGFGKDSPRGVLKRQWRNALIAGDSFAHIITDAQGRLTNLKPLGDLTIIRNSEGIIIRYEQETTHKTFSPEEIYHLSNEPGGDGANGIPFAECLENLILARNEALSDLKIESHRVTKPIQFFEVETDDPTKLNSIETTINTAYKKSENVVIPAGVVKEIKKTSTNMHSFDVLSYLKFLVRQFVTGCGMPEVIMGWTEGSTEASTNVIYLAYQQEIEDMQIYNEEQAETQLGITFELEFPASLEEKAMQEKGEEENQTAEKIKENNSKRGKGTSITPGKDG